MRIPTERQEIGRLGEDISVKYLENIGYSVICRNYLKKCGEIDIIAQKAKILHFIEVKTVSCEKSAQLDTNVTRETDLYRPEDNIHPSKLKRLARTIQVYLLEKHREGEPEWVFGAITVKIEMVNRRAKIRFFENIVL